MMAVAVRGHITDQGDVEGRPVLQYRIGVLRHLVVQQLDRILPGRGDGIGGAHGKTPAAAHTLVHVDFGDTVCDHRGIVGTDPLAGAAAYALFLSHEGLAVGVLFHLAGPGSAAHADVLQGTAEPCFFMSLEMGQGDQHIRVCDGLADFRLFYILQINRNKLLIGSPQSVCNQHMTADGQRREPVDIGGIQVLQSVFPAAHIKGIAVRQEGLASLFLHIIRHHSGIVGPQERQVPILPEVDLDGGELAGKVHRLESRALHEPVQLLQKLFTGRRPEVRKIHFRFHITLPLVTIMIMYSGIIRYFRFIVQSEYGRLTAISPR